MASWRASDRTRRCGGRTEEPLRPPLSHEASSAPRRMTATFGSVCVVRVALVGLVFCWRPTGVGAAPVCAHARAGRHAASLADLFDRVIQHSARLHGVSDDLHSEFEQRFLPSKNQVGRVGRNCHTSAILTPNGKENAQRMAREELTEVILKLLRAWRDPLWRFHQSLARHRHRNLSADRALEMSHMVHELRGGVEKVAEKMRVLGIIGNSVSGRASPEASLASGGGERRRPVADYDLLYCFRRDANKVQNYLKILKCRIVPENGC